ncbi:Ig-like domain-containing protein [Candidatus Izemoplasma sp. B36]|uniref:Ig-like domain-containing protein n=1 Tax=Candidatus Izemoplasma sp. B36 TaxID=3242468 RepID=UPI0035575CB8
MKKILLLLVFICFALCLTACDPTSTEASMNTNLTQTTTTTAITTTTNNYVAVTHIELIVSQAEVCPGDQITLTVNITPSNATDQTFVITLSQNTYVDFANPNNQLLLDAINGGQTNITETHVTATSNDNPSIYDSQQIYVSPSGSGACPTP